MNELAADAAGILGLGRAGESIGLLADTLP